MKNEIKTKIWTSIDVESETNRKTKIGIRGSNGMFHIEITPKDFSKNRLDHFIYTDELDTLIEMLVIFKNNLKEPEIK